jgi:hypothetical protein
VQRLAAPAGFGRSTMPMIAHDEPDQHEGDDDESFPSVETDIDVDTPFTRPPPTMQPRAPSSPVEFIEGTPPPFGGETSASAIRPIEPIVASSMGAPTQVTTQPVMMMQRRSLVWPMLAVAMVAIAGGALFLVYQQTQQAPTVLKIEQTTTPSQPVAKPENPVGPSVLTDPVTPAVSPTPPRPQHNPPPPPPPRSVHATSRNPYVAAIEPHMGEVNQCVSAHPSTELLTNPAATIEVTASGRAKAVSWKPATLDASPLGACMRNVLLATQFPAGEQTFIWTPVLH